MNMKLAILPVIMAASAQGASLLTLTNSVADGSINTAGGNNVRSDWSATTAFTTDPDESNALDFASVTVAHDSTNFYLRQQTYRTDSAGFLSFGQKIIFDTDRNRSTGYRGPSDAFAVGGEYMLEGATLYLYTGSGNDWGWNSLGTISYDDFPINDHEFTIARSSLGGASAFDFIGITDFFGGGDSYADGAHGGVSGSYFTYNTIPEPSAALLGSLGIIALLRRRK
jgi:hypothetical protein